MEKSQNTARGASFICWIIAAWQMGCQAMHGSWEQLSALTRVPSTSASPPGSCSILESPRTQEHPHSPHLIPPSRDAASPGSFEVLGADKEPEWFGGWRQGEHSWCSLPAEHQGVSLLHIQGGWLWRIQGCCAVLSTFLQIGIALPSASQSLQDAVPPVPLIKQLLLLSSFGEGKGAGWRCC